MHPLHHSSLTSRTEFASISLLLKPDDDSSISRVGESLFVVSPLATTCHEDATRCLEELHQHVTSCIRNQDSRNTQTAASDTKKTNGNHRGNDGAITDDSRPESPPHNDPIFWNDTEDGDSSTLKIFRPSEGRGIGLQYAMIRGDTHIIPKCASLLLGTGKGARTSSVGANSSSSKEMLDGILVCVGVSGWSHAARSLGERVQEIVRMMHALAAMNNTNGSRDALESVIATLILSDEEDQKTNVMVEAESITFCPEIDLEVAEKSGKSAQMKQNRRPGKKNSQLRREFSGSSDLPLAIEMESSADIARIIAERLAVLSVAENDVTFAQYEMSGQQRRRNFETEMGGKSRVRSRRRKMGELADLEDFDCPVTTSTEPVAIPALKPPSQIRATRSYHDDYSGNANKGAVPTLVAPRGDVARVSTRRSLQPSIRRQERMVNPSNAFDAFEQMNGSLSSRSLQESRTTEDGFADPFGIEGDSFGLSALSRDRITPTNQGADFEGFDPFSPPEAETRRSEVTPASVASAGSFAITTPSPVAHGDDHRTQAASQVYATEQNHALYASGSHLSAGPGSTDAFGFSSSNWASPSSPNNGKSLSTALSTPRTKTTQDAPRMAVNVALNEDLTCSYKQSKISSCSVEGVVQVQVSLDARDGVPFFLYVRDPSNHIKLVQENRRYADDITQAVVGQDEVGADYKFTVSVPISDKYFPIMRYKCNTDLRPVPIRVQTRVRLHDTLCRVALQISSNPTNDDNLTDLTIVMGVPPEVKGETLTTSPAGGVWNESKRSVVWCVAELGGGEKFQLGAQFKMRRDTTDAAEVEKPKFPVLVRCQCMYSQLSEIELEVSDIPEIFPADVSMKLARRFRLSHREKS